jgi:hypothetical protein
MFLFKSLATRLLNRFAVAVYFSLARNSGKKMRDEIDEQMQMSTLECDVIEGKEMFRVKNR